MFVKMKQLESLLKKSYKTGIETGGHDKGLYLKLPNVFVWFEKPPKKFRALIIEYFGELPKEGECFSVTKESPMPQTVMVKNPEEVFEHLEKADQKAHVLPVMTCRSRLLQVNKSVVALSDAYYKLIDSSMIDLDDEGEPTGPAATKDVGNGLFWDNENCVVRLIPTLLPMENEVYKVLAKVKVEEEDDEE